MVIGLVFLCQLQYAQNRGLTPELSKNQEVRQGKTYGIVIAISDYSRYRKLDFAHNDGSAFAGWLESKSGEIRDTNNLRVLLDKDATFSSVVNAFDWLNSKCRDGDKAYIYFAGHGDVECKSASEPGYLLCYDSPERLFASGGAMPLNYLQEMVTTLSMKNTKVVVVLDACHAGKLAGDVVNGRQRAAENMIYYVPDPNVVKILSCKANQNSREDPTLGGGRGVFSYFLTNGLMGMADANRNDKVNIAELERYLEDHIMTTTAPIMQEPIIKHSGSKMDILVKVNPFVRDSLLNEQQIQSFASIRARSIYEHSAIGADTIALPDLQHFQTCLKEQRFFEPAQDCAEYYYTKLLALAVSDDFKNEVTRNYAVALQEKAQRIINNFIEVKVAELSKSYKSGYEDYKVLPKFLDRATALLGESHYFYKNLKSNQYLFEAFAMQYEGFGIFDSVRIRKNLNLYKKSLEYNDKNPLTLYFISKYYAGKLHDRDSCDIYFNKLTEVATTWVMAYAQHADNLVRYFKDFEQAKSTVLQGWAIDSTNTYLIKALANIYFYQKQYAKAIQKYRDAEHLDSSDVLTYVNLAACYTMTGEDSLAIVNYEKSIKMDSTLMVVYMNYGWLYFKNKDYDNAERIFLKGVNLRNEYVPVKGRLCQVYLAQNKLGKVKEQLKLIKAIYPDDWRYYLYSACIEAKTGKDNKALELLRKAMKSDGFDDMRTVEESGYFEKLKKDGRLAKLIEEVFGK